MRFRILYLIGLAVAPAGAQAVAGPAAPRAVVDSFFAALATERWSVAANFLDLQVFARFLTDRVNAARSAVPMRPTTMEDLMAADSTLPRAVAEWQVARYRAASDRRPFNDFSHEFAGITSFRALEALTPLEGAARWLEANDPSNRLRRSLTAMNCPGLVLDSLKKWIPYALRTVGTAQLNDSTAYVLATREFADSGMYAPTPSTLLLRRRREGWQISPTFSMLTGDHVVMVEPQCPRRRH
jgi:hypothetical protein